MNIYIAVCRFRVTNILLFTCCASKKIFLQTVHVFLVRILWAWGILALAGVFSRMSFYYDTGKMYIPMIILWILFRLNWCQTFVYSYLVANKYGSSSSIEEKLNNISFILLLKKYLLKWNSCHKGYSCKSNYFQKLYETNFLIILIHLCYLSKNT